MVNFKTYFALALTVFTVIIFTPLGILAFFFSLIGFRKIMSLCIYKIGQVWGKVIIATTGCSVTVIGTEHIPAQGGICFVSNHVGLFDIVLAISYTGRPFGFIAKKELMFLPFINVWISILGGLFIDRKNIRKAIDTINKGIKRLQSGNSMLIFPEGTRNKGEGLLPFKAGSIKLATNSLVPIVPIAITGTYEVYERHNRVCAVPLGIVFCPPIITAEMDADVRRHQLVDMVKASIEQALLDSKKQD